MIASPYLQKLNKSINHIVQISARHWISLLVLLFVVMFTYRNVLKFEFLNWDDDQYLLANIRFQPGADKDLISFFKGFDVGNYHPLTMLSYAMDMASPLQPLPFHRTNLILHIINTLLVYILLRHIQLPHGFALTACACFALHPLRVETVAWISDRKDLLMTLFYLSSLTIFIRYVYSKSNTYLVLSLILFSAACLSKATAVTLPLVCMLYTFYYHQYKKISEHILLLPYFIVAGITGIVAVLAQMQIAAIKTGTAITTLWKPIMAIYNLAIYLAQHIVPIGLKTYYTYPTSIQDILLPIIIIVFAIVVISVFVLLHLKNRNLSFLYAAGVISLLPVLQIISVGDALRADRYTYLPAAFWCAIPLALIQDFKELSLKNVYIVGMIYILFLVTITHQLLPSWKNSETLWKRSIREQPQWYNAYNNLGTYYLSVGRVAEAKQILRQALSADRNQEGAYINLGFIYNAENKPDSAAFYLSKGLEIFPEQAILLNNYAYALYLQKKYNEALLYVNRSIDLKQDNAYAYRNRALIYEALKQYNESCEDTKRAVALNYVKQWGDDVLLLQQRVCGKNR
jgi:hypothetical protein